VVGVGLAVVAVVEVVGMSTGVEGAAAEGAAAEDTCD